MYNNGKLRGHYMNNREMNVGDKSLFLKPIAYNNCHGQPQEKKFNCNCIAIIL